MATHKLSFSVPGTACAVAEARQRVLAALRGWGLRPDSGVLDAVELATSELVTNAVKHAGPEPVTVYVGLRDGTVRIDVYDSSSELPQLRLPGAAEENGRGLLIVAALATRYAVESTPTGKRCWAEFLVPATSLAKAADASPHPVPHISLPRS